MKPSPGAVGLLAAALVGALVAAALGVPSGGGTAATPSATPGSDDPVVASQPTDTTRVTPSSVDGRQGGAPPAGGGGRPDPLTRDSDGDGLPDGRELPLGTDPTTADTDGDWLDDDREAQSDRFDPTVPDRDNDGLTDGEELRNRTRKGVPLPGADPGSMDLYLTVAYHENATELSPADRRDLERLWRRRVDVDNPDGSTGVDVHLVESDVPAFEREWSPTPASMNWFREHVYRALPPEKRGVYKMAIVGPDTDALVTGAYFDDDADRRYTLHDEADPRSISHELLHMFLGTLDRPCGDDDRHACEGLLGRHEVGARVQDWLVDELEREGIPR